MEPVFADAHFWIAVADPSDQWHQLSRATAKEMKIPRIVTTDEVLVEVLYALSGRGWKLRAAACDLVYRLRRDPHVAVIEQSRFSFDAGLILYDARHDKGYSLVDCISMITMRKMEIKQILTNDRHFAQEGFEVLIK